MSGNNAYRNGKVHVCRQLCDTCVFRSGNLMHLEPGRLAAMVSEARANESAIICHSTLYRDGVDNAVCRGFYDRHPTQPLQMAQRLDLVEFDDLDDDGTVLARRRLLLTDPAIGRGVSGSNRR